MRPAAPVIRLTGAIKEWGSVYDHGAARVPLTLIVRNAGSLSVRITAIHGGCKCREVDQSRLSADLRPGDALDVGLRLQPQAGVLPPAVMFSVETDRGTLGVPTELRIAPDESLSPSNVALYGLNEADDGAFTLTHRALYREGEPEPVATLSLPATLRGEAVATRTVRPPGLAGYTSVETTYRLAVADRSLGLHRDVVVLRDTGGRERISAPVTWKRWPFLAAMPDRVLLGSQPVRVALRCPDKNVELRKVLSTPKGVEAEIVPPRALTVRAVGKGPRGTGDVIEVATSAEGRPPLRISVVRLGSGPGPSRSTARETSPSGLNRPRAGLRPRFH
jgi:hypothetical protein